MGSARKLKDSMGLFEFALFCFLVLLLATFNIVSGINKVPRVMGVATDFSEEKAYWEDLVIKNPTYQDGWIELAKVEYYEGNVPAARQFLEKAKLIDPNSPKILESEIMLLSGK